MQSTDEIRERIQKVLQRHIGDEVAGIAPGDDLATALGERYDSLAAMECITAVEGEFGIEVDFVAHDVRHWFATIDRMTEFVSRELEDRALLGGAQ